MVERLDACLLPAILAFAMVVAGCAGHGPPEDSNVSGTSPTATATSVLPPATTQPAPIPYLRGANLTDCAGVWVSLIVPAELVRDDVPKNYTVSTGTPNSETMAGDASIVLELISCQKIAIDGTDSGPATLASLFISIKTPPQAEITDSHSWYLLEMNSDHDSFGRWLSDAGAQAARGRVEHSLVPQGPPPAVADLQGKLIENQSLVYSVQGFPPQQSLEEQKVYRLYYGEQPESDFWEARLAWKTSGDWPAKLEISDNSRLAKILEASGPLSCFTSSMLDVTRTLTPIASSR